MPDSSKALRRMRLSTLSRIQAGLRTQQITLASGKSSTSAGSLVVQPRLVSKITVSGAASCVIGVEDADEQPLANLVVEENRAFVARARLGQHRAEEAVDAGCSCPTRSAGSAAAAPRASVEPERGKPEMKWRRLPIARIV